MKPVNQSTLKIFKRLDKNGGKFNESNLLGTQRNVQLTNLGY